MKKLFNGYALIYLNSFHIVSIYKDENVHLKWGKGGLPGGPLVKNPPANAEDMFDPWPGRIAHAVGQLSPCALTPEPML